MSLNNHRRNRQIPQPCPHLVDFRSRSGHKPFRALQDCLRVKPLGRAAIRRDPDEIPRCSTCGHCALRLYACVSCASVFCHSLPESSHAAFHAESMPGHEIAVDVDRAELFCCACCDQVYDHDFDAAVVLAQTAASTLGGGLTSVPPENQRKRKRVDYRPWTPDPREQLLMGTGSSPLQSGNEESSCLPWGLRGLNNLGNTCFMNSVLQALLHTPLLRNYFLSDRHNRYLCQQNNKMGNVKKKNATGQDNNNSKNLRPCLACDVDAIFSAIFSANRKPYSPANFLYSWWRYAANLASYEQQDAHEFFISMLDGIHEKVEEGQGKPQSQGSGDCCIAHRVFSGILRSDVTCTACGFTSTTYDPCVDISLDLESNQGDSSKMSSSKPIHACNGEADRSGISTLIGCLDRFTRPERLGSDQKFFCQRCQVRQESLKQMSIRKLPLVSCFHIKRFEHSTIKRMSMKVDRYLQFPFSLDMALYLSSSILRSRFGNRIFACNDDEPDTSNDLSSEFELFVVITLCDGGHYVTYLRLSDQWYKFGHFDFFRTKIWVTRIWFGLMFLSWISGLNTHVS